MPKFTKQHYEVIARAFRDGRAEALKINSDPTVTTAALGKVFWKLAHEFTRDNEAFNLRKFHDACYPGQPTKGD